MSSIEQTLSSPKFVQLFKETIGHHYILSFGIIYGLLFALSYVVLTKTKFSPLPLILIMLSVVGVLFLDAYIKTKGRVFDHEDIEQIYKSLDIRNNFWHFVKHTLWLGLFFALGLALSKGFNPYIIIPIVLLGIFVLVKKTDIATHNVTDVNKIPENITDSFGTHEGLMYHLLIFALFLGLGYILGSYITPKV